MIGMIDPAKPDAVPAKSVRVGRLSRSKSVGE
jgi:hypothetical protein